jgi:hypothetical protein
MSIRQRRRLGKVAKGLNDWDGVSDEVRSCLIESLELIAKGMDANEALGLTLARGEKLSNEKHRLNLAKLFHWILGAQQKAPDGYGLSVTAALEAAASLSQGGTWTDPKTKEVLGKGDFPVFRRISYEALRKAWYNPDYSDLKKLEINESDFDFPYDTKL